MKTTSVGLYKLTKLDRRFNGSDWFRYALSVDTEKTTWYTHANPYRIDRTKNFQELRVWCWEQWGPSMEVGIITSDMIDELRWAWEIEPAGGRRRIYLKGDEELSYAMLRWS